MTERRVLLSTDCFERQATNKKSYQDETDHNSLSLLTSHMSATTEMFFSNKPRHKNPSTTPNMHVVCFCYCRVCCCCSSMAPTRYGRTASLKFQDRQTNCLYQINYARLLCTRFASGYLLHQTIDGISTDMFSVSANAYRKGGKVFVRVALSQSNAWARRSESVRSTTCSKVSSLQLAVEFPKCLVHHLQ